MKKAAIIVQLLFLWLLSGCTPKDFNEPGMLSTSSQDTSKSFSGSYSAVWDATVAALKERKYALSSSQRESGLIATDWIYGKSDRLFSGYGETRIPYSIRFKLSFRLRPTKEGVDVKVGNEEQYYSDAVTAGTDFSGSLYQWIPTQTSTAKEAALLEEIGQQLASARVPKPKK